MAFNTAGEAITRQVVNLSQSISTSINSMAKVRRVRQSDVFADIADAESKEDWEGLIAIIQNQIGKARSENVTDHEFITQLETKLSSARAKQKDWQLEQDFLALKTSYDGGISTADDVLYDLERKLLTTKEPRLVSAIKDQIAEMTAARASDERELAQLKLQNQQNERIGLEIYQEDINWAKYRMREAVANENPLEIERWENIISQYENNFTTKDIKITDRRMQEESEKFNWTAMEKLNYYKDTIERSDKNVPIIIDGIQYNSRSEYYQTQYEKYLGSSFATDFSNGMTEYFDDIVSIKGNYGGVPQLALDEFKSAIDSMRALPEMQARAGEISKIESTFREGVEKEAQALFASSLKSEDFEGGLRELQNLSSKYNFDTLQYENALKDKTIQSKIDAANLVRTRENLAELGLNIPDDVWNAALSTDIGPTEVAAANNIQPERFGGFEQFQGRRLLATEGGRPFTEEEKQIVHADKTIAATEPTSRTPEEMGAPESIRETINVSPGQIGSIPLEEQGDLPTLANIQGQEVEATPDSTIQQETTTAAPPQQIEETTAVPVESKGIKLPTGETVEDPFYIGEGQAPLSSADFDRLNAFASSGSGNLVPLSGSSLRFLKSYYNRIPGLKELVETQLAGTGSALSYRKDPDLPMEAEDNFVRVDAISGTSIKKLVNKLMKQQEQNLGIQPQQQAGYVKDLEAYNKQLRKKQNLPEVRF